MSTEQTRKTIESFVAAFKSQDFDALDALATPTATYQFRGPADSPLAGVIPYSEFIARQREFAANACHAFETEQTGVIFVEGAHGAVESRSRFEDKSGKVYANEAMVKFLVDKEGKIEEIREYEDSVPILKFLGKTY